MVASLIGGLLSVFFMFYIFYRSVLRWFLEHKSVLFLFTFGILLWGGMVWLGFNSLFGWLPNSMKTNQLVVLLAHTFPGLGKEFMPPLDEGSFLFMPTTMPHASMGEALDVLQKQDKLISAIPEIESVVGKLGRAESPLDPAPISMFETVITYKPEFISDSSGKRLAFKYSNSGKDFFRDEQGNQILAPDGEPYFVRGAFIRDEHNQLIPDSKGKPFRLWRPPLRKELNPERTEWEGIKSPEDIWEEILKASSIPGTTSAPKLQPIAARIVMLQSGMRAPMGVKVKGPDLETIEKFSLEIETALKEVPMIDAQTVIADRIIGQPYLEIVINREAIARYGISIMDVQNVIEVAVGGKHLTTVLQGRERYPVRIRYFREFRDSLEELEQIVVASSDGAQIPLVQIADIRFVRGPQMIKSEDTFLVGYIIFDKQPHFAEVDVVIAAQEYLNYKLEQGELTIPEAISFEFAGNYLNQVRAEQKLRIILPLALFLIFLILYSKTHLCLLTRTTDTWHTQK